MTQTQAQPTDAMRTINGQTDTTVLELLHALQRLLEAFQTDCARIPSASINVVWETSGGAIAEARTAIAKAEGRDV